ncbi:MAG: glucan biosynthesis protein D [Nevskiaceae bacterium]|nr:MAG: glucan biosynthesis protein D [Nevskiaceae bacterium]
MQRRDFLRTAVAIAAAGLPASQLFAAPAAEGDQPFDYAWLKGHARALAGQPYVPPSRDLPKALANLDYDQFQSIRFRPEHALWADQGLNFQLQFFHLGYGYREAVRMHEVVDGKARPLAYDPRMFDLSKSGVSGKSLPKDLGYAGLRIHFHTDWNADFAVFLGASYFRAIGATKQYGLSARGLAIDSGMGKPEEFPIFTAFWLQRPGKDANVLTVYALLESASITGAYRFDIAPGEPLTMDVDAALYPRKPIERLGVAPLTSMYLFGENDRRMASDWRPEIHDSDGLSINNGASEWIWRPLTNPAGVRVNAYVDENPRGYGLLQRDRNFDHYQDDGVFYDRRPSLWVEPKSGAWGRGAVQLIELPAPDETYDNIVAYWNPAAKPQPGQELLYSYRMYWGAQMPAASPLGQVVATRTGIGGVVGQKRQYFSWRFAVDFAGGSLAQLARDAQVEPVIWSSRGKVEITSARPQFEVNGYRAMFDLKPTDDSTEPIDLRLYLRLKGQPLTETWTYQWIPPPPSERHY